MNTIGERIRIARKAKELSQKELADKVSRTKNVISNWERGDNQPDADTIGKLCAALDVMPNWLLGWESQKDDEIETIAAHNDGPPLTKEEQEKLIEFAKFLKSQRKDDK